VGEGLGPTGRRSAPARPWCARAGGARGRAVDAETGEGGVADEGPHAIVQGGAVESQPLRRGLHNTVRVAVELDLKQKFQIRLKSNGSNGFKFLQILTTSNRTFPCSKNLKQNIVLKISERSTTFSIATSPDSE
jgi:hypothetical protein